MPDALMPGAPMPDAPMPGAPMRDAPMPDAAMPDAPMPGATVPGPVDALLAQVDAAPMIADLQVFAGRTKLSGTAEELESFRHLQGRMDGLGFRTTLLFHDALISLPGASRVEAGEQALRSITHSFSRPSAPGGTRGRLVNVGLGDAAGFAGRDLRGAVLLVEGIAGPDVSARASKAGAAGQLHVSPNEHLYQMCVSPVWGSPAADDVAHLPTTVVATVAQADGDALRARLAAGEALEAVIHAEVDTGWRKTPVLVAEMDGPDPEGEFILFSNHHDTWFRGVMDNGGANATTIEVARVCAARRDRWRRGLRICFWSGHSHGRYSGSAWYADEHWNELDRRCAAHVNLDSTGAAGAAVLTGSGVATELAAVARAAIAAETGQAHEGRRIGRFADHSFWGVGVPAMFGSLSHQPPSPGMRNALGWWWHTEHDLLDKISPANLVRDTRIAARVVWQLLTDPVLPLDIAAQAGDLLGQLQGLQAALRGRFDAAPLLRAAEACRDAAAALPSAAGGDAGRINRALMRASRALVPLDYTAGGRFQPDPALPQPAWPVLEPLRALAAARPGTDEAYALTVSATRARNKLLSGLRDAVSALGATE